MDDSKAPYRPLERNNYPKPKLAILKVCTICHKPKDNMLDYGQQRYRCETCEETIAVLSISS